MPRLAVTIITLNEAQDLPDCLRSVAFADDILVVDSGSTDRTVELARQMGARVIENPWPGYAAQRQFALERAQGDWCLMLDADERVSPELQGEIAVAITRDNVNGYFIPFVTHMFDKALLHGGDRGERNLRLVRKAKAHWTQSGCGMDGAVVEGELGALKDPIVHIPYASLAEYFDRLNTKTSQCALDLHQSGVRASRLHLLRHPFLFLWHYVVLLGFLDGWAGFLHASFRSLFDFITQAKLLDIERRAGSLSPDTIAQSAIIPRLATPLQTSETSAEPAALPTSVEATSDRLAPSSETPSERDEKQGAA
ncbi:MAG: glycosyltransferase family 2 protein [Myxococcales bacterium]|jgi:glycosyltransferase involved in cell wall biosynthesis|nr:glycosyltransferase family 2 protein [Myxococcales bacterium]